MNWFKKLLASKISVNITIVDNQPNDVKTSTTPQVIQGPIKVSHIRKSNFRFVHEEKTDHAGHTRSFYMTEEYKDGRWAFVSESLASDKEKAMALHLKVLEKGNLEDSSTKTIFWEGLGIEETKQWVALQTKEETCKQ